MALPLETLPNVLASLDLENYSELGHEIWPQQPLHSPSYFLKWVCFNCSESTLQRSHYLLDVFWTKLNVLLLKCCINGIIRKKAWHMDQNWDFSLIPSSKLFFSDLIVRRQFESEIASVFPPLQPHHSHNERANCHLHQHTEPWKQAKPHCRWLIQPLKASKSYNRAVWTISNAHRDVVGKELRPSSSKTNPV